MTVMAGSDSETKDSSGGGANCTSDKHNFFLLSSQSGFGGARFARGDRLKSFSNSPFLQNDVPGPVLAPASQSAERIDLDIGIRRETLKLIKVPDTRNTYVLDFEFDARVDCQVSIVFLAEEISDTSNKTLKFETSYPVQLSASFLHCRSTFRSP